MDKSFLEQDLPFKTKLKNFIYYYKIPIIVITLIIAALTAGIVSIVTKVHPDVTVLFAQYGYTTPDDIKALEEIFSKYTEDYNHDGKQYVKIKSINFSEQNDGYNLMHDNTSKLVAELALNETHIILFDDDIYETLNKQNAFVDLDRLFDEYKITEPDKIKRWYIKSADIKNENAELFGRLSNDLSFGVRVKAENGGENYQERYLNSCALLKNLMLDNKVEIKKK